VFAFGIFAFYSYFFCIPKEVNAIMNPYMKIAVEEAQNGIRAGHGGPFGCVIVKNNAIVGRGHNQVVLLNDPTCHGEMMAIHDACRSLGTFDLSGCDLYTTAEPCPMCLGAIYWAHLDKIYYANDRKDAANHRNDITWLVDRIESLGWEVTLRRRNR
jgi:guanine deaminase